MKLLSRSAAVLRCLLLPMLMIISVSATAQSSVDTDISITRGEAVKISDVDDWLIGVFSPTDNIFTIQYNWDPECVFTTTGAFSVTAVSQNGGGNLFLQSAGGDTMTYEIYSYSRVGGNYQLLRHLTSTFNINNRSGSTSMTCADEPVTGTNLWFAALVRPPAFNAAPPGIYQDLVTITITPE